VRREPVRAAISHASATSIQAVKTSKKKASGISAETCPKCKQAPLLKGKSAYGCSAYKAGCDFVLSFVFADKKISENQYIRLLQKGSTVNLKDFKTETGSVEGLLRFDTDFKLVLEPKKIAEVTSDTLVCPKCKKGSIIKGKTAYGCSDYKMGCDFRVSFDMVKQKINGHQPTKELVHAILKESV